MLDLLHAAGGVALVLFGIRFLRKGLDRLVGPRLGVWLGRITGGVLRAAGAGVLIGVVVPSSTSLSLLAVSFVREGSLRLHRAITLLLGAFVGITVTVHIIALDVFEHAPILALAGVALFQGTRSTWPRAVGQVLIALALVFLGVGIIGASAGEVARTPAAATLVELAAQQPWITAGVAAVLTVLAQSSTATLAVLLALGLVNPALLAGPVALPFVAGANAGIAATTLIAGWARVESRRLGVALVVLRFAGAAGAVLALPAIAGLFDALPGPVPTRVAGAHTAFNLAVLAASLPLARPLAALVQWAIRPAPEEDDRQPQFIRRGWASDPAVALSQSKREIGRVAATVRRMLDEFWDALSTGDEATVRRLKQRDDHVDRLEREVKRFLTREITEELPPELARARIGQLRFLTDLEAVGDAIDRNLAEVALKRSRRGVRFSPQGLRELRDFYEAAAATLELATAVFVSDSPDLARKLLAHKARVRDEELRLRERHYERLRAGPAESMESTDLHLEVLSQLKHISHTMAGAAYNVLENGHLERPGRAERLAAERPPA